MNDLTLYTMPLCPYVQRVRLVLAVKGVAAREIPVGRTEKPADFLDRSPDGKVPLLVRGPVTVVGSAVIAEYLEETFPWRALMPTGPAERARMRYWIGFADALIYGVTHDLLVSFERSAERGLADRVAANLVQLVEGAFDARPFIGGSEPNLADLTLLPWVEQVEVLEELRGFRIPAACKRLLDWRASLAEREAFRPVLRSPDFYVEGYRQLMMALAAPAA